jgi:tetratricopeptide (TPR) repeat protein
VRRAIAGTLLALLAISATALARGQETVIDVRSTRPAGNSFEALWSAFRRADASGDAETARRLFEEIRRLRTERNVRSLEEIGLVLVGRGLDQLEKGDRARAEEEFRNAIKLDPHLPDAYFALARTKLKSGPFGFVAASSDVVSGLMARAPTSRGRQYLLVLGTAVMMLALLATVTVFSVALLLRYGTLLLHDLEETFGPNRGRAAALGVHGVLLMLPLLTFQGYAWLPFWWLALLWAYTTGAERALIAGVLAAGVAVGPAVALLESRTLATQNPLFRASMLAIEGGPDRRALNALETEVRNTTDDRDLVYLLGIEYKKSGLYDESAGVYRDILRKDDKDAIALNNLANLEFARGEFPAAITRYNQAREAGGSADVKATVNYNLALAYLQKFERQPADEARSQADRLGGGLTRTYDSLWKYDTKNENAVVDLALSPDQVWAKFAGTRAGIGVKGMAARAVAPIGTGTLLASTLNRFSGFLIVFALVVFLLERWRGERSFTMRCLKCGTPFCKRCHLGAAPTGLCTQCYHLFIVRDGVSGPARNQKLLEVQKEDERRERIFRALSLVSPGAGHLYSRKTILGISFAFLWYLLLALAFLAGRLLPVTEAPQILAGYWALGAGVVLLLVLYVAANRARPDFEVSLPIPRGPRRTRAA